MVLEFHGRPPDVEHLRKAVFVPALGGTIPELLADYARQQDFDARVVEGSLSTLVGSLEANTPPIVLFGPNGDTDVGHFVVVTSLDLERQQACYHTGSARNRCIDLDDFLDKWARARHTLVLVGPSPLATKGLLGGD